MTKFLCNGLRHSMTEWVNPNDPSEVLYPSVVDRVEIEAEDKDQALLIQKYLGIAFCNEILTKYPDGRMKPEDRDQYRLPEGYHLEIKLVKDSK